VTSNHDTAPFFDSVGRATADGVRALRGAFEFTGRVTAAVFSGIAHPRSFKLPDFGAVFMRAGADAVPVTLLVGFLLGFIIAYMSAAMLNKFGAEIYVANLIGLALIRELGTIVAAIVLAARSASAFAAEIGTMVVNDEISAMRTMGIDPVRYLALPRIAAGALALPLLSLFADLAGLAGGYLTLAIFGYSLKIFVTNAFAFCTVGNLVTTLAKGVVFGVLISATGCRCGLETGLGPTPSARPPPRRSSAPSSSSSRRTASSPSCQALSESRRRQKPCQTPRHT
jgi:phospholipid/cholesterol/gamma-HCH transport system permease protein